MVRICETTNKKKFLLAEKKRNEWNECLHVIAMKIKNFVEKVSIHTVKIMDGFVAKP